MRLFAEVFQLKIPAGENTFMVPQSGIQPLNSPFRQNLLLGRTSKPNPTVTDLAFHPSSEIEHRICGSERRPLANQHLLEHPLLLSMP